MPYELDTLIADVRTRIEPLGFELADLTVGGASRRPRIQVRIDRLDAGPGQGVTVDDCAAVSRALEAWLDAAGPFGSRYILEVSSPGIDRPIRWREHWERFAGHDVQVTVAGRGRIRARIVRVVPEDDAVVLALAGDEEPITVPLGETKNARLAVDWEPRGLRVRQAKEN